MSKVSKPVEPSAIVIEHFPDAQSLDEIQVWIPRYRQKNRRLMHIPKDAHQSPDFNWVTCAIKTQFCVALHPFH